ncbi:MAG TPA: GPW/gp25 family protein [Pyrinomonadaceae bacterium]|nr:GPW/gp25 family protein [Pyrinomonadaceae bacterium]
MAEQEREFLGTGWAFPPRPDANGTLRYVSGEELVIEGIEIVLGTSPGERQMRPEFGCAIYELVGEANTVALRGLVRERVREALTLWEPRIDVLDIRVEAPEEQQNRMDIHIDYRIRSNNSFFNLVYPFFLTEGPQQQ